MIETQIAIVGGGLAGLHAARLLQKAGVAFELLEARERLGGRILTTDETGLLSEDGFDLGPSWFWPQMQPKIGTLIAELGLPVFAQHSNGDVLFERMPRESLQRYRGPGTGQQSMRLAGGTASLVRALANDLPTARIHLGAPVTAMAHAKNGIELAVSGTGFIRAQHIIAALPPRLLEAQIVYTPTLGPETIRRWQACETWMAPHAKFFAIYDRPFWRENDLSGTAQSMVGPMAEIHDATTASGRPALFGFIGIPAAQRAAMGDAALTKVCMTQFARLFGPDATAPRATLLKDWATDPLTATASDQNAGAHIMPSSKPWISGTWAKRLILAGSETSLSEPGYLAGAISAAERAVGEVLVQLGNGGRHG